LAKVKGTDVNDSKYLLGDSADYFLELTTEETLQARNQRLIDDDVKVGGVDNE
jgi:hypothetical protein